MSWAVSVAEGNLGREMKWATLEKLSTTVRIVVLQQTGEAQLQNPGKCVTRGDQEQGVAEGGQTELAVESYSEHAATKAETSGTIVGHQKHCLGKTRV